MGIEFLSVPSDVQILYHSLKPIASANKHIITVKNQPGALWLPVV